MYASVSKSVSVPARAAHWAGCLLGTALVALYAVMVVGQGPPPDFLANPQTISLIVMLIGFAVAWWHDLAGGVVSLIGISTFYALNFAAAGDFPRGLVFPLSFVPGVLCVLAWLLRRFARP